MRVNLVGPAEGHESEHKIDAATAAFLAVQLSKRHIAVSAGGITVEPVGPIEITLDDEKLWVTDARVKFWTAGSAFEGELTLTLAKEKP